MTDETTSEVGETTKAEIETLIRARFVDSLVISLRRRFPDIASLAEDAVLEAVERAVKRAHAVRVETLKAYLYTVATNVMRRWWRHVDLPAGGPDLSSEAGDEGRPRRRHRVDHHPSAEDEALLHATWMLVKRLVSDWPNENIRTITILYLEAAYLGEPLSVVEAAELAEEILGRPVSISSVSTWKSRGLRKLTEEISEMEKEEQDDERSW